MGSDFLERTKKTIKRSWDRQRVALGTSDLLTRPPDCAGRSVGEIIGYARLHPGEKLTVEPNGPALVARRGLDEVVRITTAAADVVKGVKDSCGVACGHRKVMLSICWGTMTPIQSRCLTNNATNNRF